jgi:class 3 adenylate cyclase/tetratricopeptide (TPR) repeat protein
MYFAWGSGSMIRTQTTTVVFTDPVGSTELTIRLGHDAYETMRRMHFESLRLAALAHQGSEIKSTGDGLVFAFTSAAEAVASMIRMQQAVDRAARRGDGQPQVRIGASVGETNRDGNDIFGIAVVEAARLCAAALPGQILVSNLIPGLIRGLEFKFGSVGEFVLKGLPDRVLACAVEWLPRDMSDDIIPLPPKISHVPTFGVYGREPEQAIIEQCWTQAKEGIRQVVLLAGEPGIGKTRLAIEAGRVAYSDAGTVLLGTCDEDIHPPYRPFAEALRHYVMKAPDEVLVQHAREHQGDLLHIAPLLAERVPNVPKPHMADAETERYLMFDAVVGLLATASAHRPIMLILDDLQWAGAPELLLLKHIVASPKPMHLLIIVTYRDTDLSPMHPLAALLADFRNDHGITRITLGGLDEQGVIELMTASIGRVLDQAQLDMARAIRRNTEGSPLFVCEVLRNFAELGASFIKAEQHTTSGDLHIGIPEGVKEAIGRRLSRFSSDTNKVLRIASVIGLEFDVALLKNVAEIAEGTILDAIDEAKSAAIITEAPSDTVSYAFTHVLVRATLYDALNPERRARMHQRVGTALEQLAVDRPSQRIDELARHWLAAGKSGDPAKAISYARQAGDKSLAGLAFEQAAKYYEQALSLLARYDRDAEPLRCDLLIALGDAQRRAGDVGYRLAVDRAIEIARSLADAKHFALAALGSGRPEHPFANANVIDQRLIALYEEAIARLGNEDENLLRARLFAQLAGEMLYTPQHDRRRDLSREAVEIARRCGDKAVLGQALHIYASAINEPATLRERLVVTAEQGVVADELVSLETRWSAAYQRMGALLESGDMEGTSQMLARMKETASKLRQPFFSWATAHAGAMITVMSGASSAEEEVRAAFELGSAGGQPEAKMTYLSQLSVIRRDQGRHGELIEPLRGFVETFPHLPVWRVVLAGLYCETDRFEEARAEMSKLVANQLEIRLDWTWASSIFSLGQICADLDDRKLAAVYYPQARPVAGQVGVTGVGLICYGSLAFPCGQFAACLSQWRDAEQYFNQALAMNTRIGARPYVVRTLRAYAGMLLDRSLAGDNAHAAKLIEEGRIEADKLGMRREVIRLDRLRHRMESPKESDGDPVRAETLFSPGN